MNFLHRLGYYLGGFSVGLILLFFIFNGKRTQCHYGPEARLLNDLSDKQWIISSAVTNTIELDSLKISNMLMAADVDFGLSNTRLDSCKIYVLNTYVEQRSVQLRVENCSHDVKIKALTYKD